MKFTKENIDGLLPNIKGLVEPRVEQRLYEAFRRVYEIMYLRLDEQQKEFDTKISTLVSASNSNINTLANLNNLIGAFSQPLVGGVADTVLQSVVSSYGPQAANTFLAGPIPSFRAITLGDLPAIPQVPATQLNADGTILDVNNISIGEYIKRVGNTLVGAFPIGTSVLTEGVVPVVEGILYTTPATYKTLFRFLILENISGGSLDVNVRITNALNVEVYNNTFTVAAGATINLIINFIMEEDFRIRSSTTSAGVVNYWIYGSQESL